MALLWSEPLALVFSKPILLRPRLIEIPLSFNEPIMLTWLGLLATTLSSLIGIWKDVKKRRRSGSGSERSWLSANKLAIVLTILALVGAAVAGAGLAASEKERDQAKDAEETAEAERDSARIELRAIEHQQQLLFESMIVGLSAPPRARLFVRLADTIPWAAYVDDKAAEVARAPGYFEPGSKAHLDNALQEALFPRTLYRETVPRPRRRLGFFVISHGLWTTRLDVTADGHLLPQIPTGDQPTVDTVFITRDVGSVFVLNLRHSGTVNGIDIYDNLRTRTGASRPLVEIGAEGQEEIARRLASQIREATVTYCLDANSRWVIFVPLKVDTGARQAGGRTGIVSLFATDSIKIERRPVGRDTSDPCSALSEGRS